MNLPTPAPPQPTELARLQAGEPNRADRARRAAEHGYDLDPAKVGLVCQDLTVAQGISGTFVRPARGDRMRKFTEAERRRLIHMYEHRAGA